MEPESQSNRKNKGKLFRRVRFFRRREVLDFIFRSHWLWGCVFTLTLTALLTPGLRFEPVRYELGTIAPVDIRAPYDFSYEDEVTTETRREAAAAEVLDIYDYNNQAAIQSRNAIRTAFELGRNKIPEGEVLDEVARDQLFLDLRDTLGVQLDEDEFAVLLKERFRAELEQALADAVGEVLTRDIVASKERLEAAGRPIIRRDESTRVNLVVQNFSRIITTEEAKRLLDNQINQLNDLPPAARRRLEELGSRFIIPTLTFNFVDTERRRVAAREEVQPVYFQVRKGRVIVRAGDEIDENVIRQLAMLSDAEGTGWRMAKAVGAFLISAVLMLCLWKLMRTAQSTTAWRRRSFALVGLIIVLHLAMARLIFFVAGALAGQIMRVPFNNENSYRYIVPFAAVAILVRLLESRHAAFLASVVFAVLLGLMSGDLYLGIFCLLSCLGAILGYLQYKQRTALIKAGLFVGSVNVVNIVGINLLTENLNPGINFGFDMLCAFVGGAGVAIVVSFLLPAFESFFQRTTDIKLLELSNHNIPVLRQMTIEAPGTYHHSVVVGTLAESAAEAIRANAIFCRTAALYHDIGKLKKVDYFVENQIGPNKHDKLSPRMSALIISSHVKEGIEMAKEMDLPQEIVDIIPQHHGTKLITYFYEKAKEHQNPSLGDVSEEDFRYPGPKPQTKEAGIIMIADGVEAASRTLEDPSPARLKGVISQIIDYIFLDGQLDECDLTLRDLERISQSFLRVLVGMHHHRVDYPGFDFEKKVETVVVPAQNGKVQDGGADP
jgi:putative nucleotidyltransferase with HDIG domain